MSQSLVAPLVYQAKQILQKGACLCIFGTVTVAGRGNEIFKEIPIVIRQIPSDKKTEDDTDNNIQLCVSLPSAAPYHVDALVRILPMDTSFVNWIEEPERPEILVIVLYAYAATKTSTQIETFVDIRFDMFAIQMAVNSFGFCQSILEKTLVLFVAKALIRMISEFFWDNDAALAAQWAFNTNEIIC